MFAQAEKHLVELRSATMALSEVGLALVGALTEKGFFGVAVDFLGMKMGANVRTFNIGDINETTVFSPDGTGQVYTPNFSIIGASLIISGLVPRMIAVFMNSVPSN